jgi:hypothetical protein
MQETSRRAWVGRWKEFELPGSVASAVAPALVIHDHDDREVPFASGVALGRAWRGARMVRTRGLGHRAILRDAGVVQDALDFIADRTVFPRPLDAGEALRLPRAGAAHLKGDPMDTNSNVPEDARASSASPLSCGARRSSAPPLRASSRSSPWRSPSR